MDSPKLIRLTTTEWNIRALEYFEKEPMEEISRHLTLEHMSPAPTQVWVSEIPSGQPHYLLQFNDQYIISQIITREATQKFSIQEMMTRFQTFNQKIDDETRSRFPLYGDVIMVYNDEKHDKLQSSS